MDVAVALKPPKVPSDGPDTTVHVSVSPAVLSLAVNNELIGAAPEFSQMAAIFCGLPFTNAMVPPAGI